MVAIEINEVKGLHEGKCDSNTQDDGEWPLMGNRLRGMSSEAVRFVPIVQIIRQNLPSPQEKNPYPKLNDSEKRIVIAPSLVGHPDGLPLHTYRRFPVFRWVCQIAEVDLGATMRPEFDSGPNQTDADLSS